VATYFPLAAATTGRTLFVPELPLDRAVPLQPAWTPIYLSLWIFSFLPVFVVRGVELRRRTILAYLTVVITAYAGFLAYPTAAPRPATVPGDDVFAWSLRTLYDLDPQYNCFPSLHVAYSFLAALSAYRVHRGVGAVAVLWATLIGISTLFIKQHYVADVAAGTLLAFAAYVVLLHGYPRRPGAS
jgi:membrane-associated phospholipid phosphatase